MKVLVSLDLNASTYIEQEITDSELEFIICWKRFVISSRNKYVNRK